MLYTFVIEGNLAADPQLRHTNDGTAVCQIRILRNGRRRDRSGNWVDGRTVAIDVTCWRDLAQRVARLRKGDTVIVDCFDDLRAESYGERTTLRVTANNVAVSMRFADATSHRTRRAPVAADANTDTVRTPDGEHYAAASYADADTATG
jgi:single-strand DNA-binding protein